MKVMAPTATAFKKPTTPVAGGREGPKPPARPSPSSASSCLASGGSPNLESKHTQRQLDDEAGFLKCYPNHATRLLLPFEPYSCPLLASQRSALHHCYVRTVERIMLGP
eukprot:1156772-Pelagomonas_calceolata.AAC.20